MKTQNVSKIVISSLLIASLLFGTSQANQVKAWFGAGSTPGWPLTTTGLRGEIQLPYYKFSPDFYRVGDTVSITAQGFNNGSSDVTSHYYMAIDRVMTINGEDVTDGDPDTPGVNENDLRTLENNGQMTQQMVALIDMGTITFPASGSASLSASYGTNQTGYYQFDIIDLDPSTGDYRGHILAAGFFRVLAAESTPTPSATPEATPEATAEPTAAPAAATQVNPEDGKHSALGVEIGNCENHSFEANYVARENGNLIEGVEVTFKYQGQEQKTKTNKSGRAGARFNYNGEASVYATANQDYPEQSQWVKALDLSSCKANPSEGKVLGSSTTNNNSNGQVLGASTTALAGTGTFANAMTIASQVLAGFGISFASIYSKKAKKQNA